MKLARPLDLQRVGTHRAAAAVDQHHPDPRHRFAAGAPEDAMVAAFAGQLAERLAPFARVDVQVIPTPPVDPCRVLLIDTHPTSARHSDIARVLELADTFGSSAFIMTDDRGRLWLGRLAQRRYWTLSRARLTAARLLEEHPHEPTPVPLEVPPGAPLSGSPELAQRHRIHWNKQTLRPPGACESERPDVPSSR